MIPGYVLNLLLRLLDCRMVKHLALSRHPVFTDANPRAEERSGLGGFELMRMSSIFPSSLCMRFSLTCHDCQKVSIAP